MTISEALEQVQFVVEPDEQSTAAQIEAEEVHNMSREMKYHWRQMDAEEVLAAIS